MERVQVILNMLKRSIESRGCVFKKNGSQKQEESSRESFKMFEKLKKATGNY